MLRKISILGVDITTASKEEILEYILENLKIKNKKSKIYTPNPEIVVYANSHPEYKNLLNSADIAIPDGIGLVMAGKILGKPLKEKISGIDLMEEICRKSAELPVSIGLLGAKEGVAEKAAECLRAMYPGLNIIFAASEWPVNTSELDRGFKIYDSRFKNEFKKFLNHESVFINHVVDVLFVAFGAPKQEDWISKNLEKLPVKVAMGVGGSFDVISGDVSRAPMIIRKTGLEWLYRLIKQPWRWRRQLALVKFIYLVIRDKTTSYL